MLACPQPPSHYQQLKKGPLEKARAQNLFLVPSFLLHTHTYTCIYTHACVCTTNSKPSQIKALETSKLG